MTGFVCKLTSSCGKKGSISFSSKSIRAVTKGAVEVRPLILMGGSYMATENDITQVAEAHGRKKKYLFSLSALLSSFKNSINLGLSDFSIYFSYFQKRYYSLTYMLQKMHLDNLFPILFLFQKYTWKEVQLHSASTAHLRICTAAWVLTWQGCALREGRVCLWCCSHRLARHALPGGKHDHTSDKVRWGKSVTDYRKYKAFRKEVSAQFQTKSEAQTFVLEERASKGRCCRQKHEGVQLISLQVETQIQLLRTRLRVY